MEAIEPFDEQRNKAKVGAGFKGGPFNANPVEAPARTFVDGVPAEVKAKLQQGSIEQGTPFDPWVSRYPGAKK